MLGIITRILLFISSYIPLFIIFVLQYYGKYGNITLAPLILGFLAIIFLLSYVENTETRPLSIEKVTSKDADVMSYIVTYIFPFLSIDLSNSMSLLSLGIFFFVLGVLYISSNMLYINPTLNLLGYHIFEIEDEDSVQIVICRRSKLKSGDNLNIVMIGNDLGMERLNWRRR